MLLSKTSSKGLTSAGDDLSIAWISLGVSANWSASLSSRRKSVSKVGLSESKLLGGWPERLLLDFASASTYL
jgi:hypothetical protein